MTYLERKTNRLFILCITVISILFSGGCNINDHRLDDNAPTVSELRLTPTPTPDAFRTKPFEMRIDVSKIYIAKIVTAKGDIVLELYPDKAPIAVNNFVALSQEGYYDNITFHRVIRNFVAQSGDPTGTGQGVPGYTIQDEYNEKASNNFKQMYGKDASFININNINEITKTLNQLLLKKELVS